jgi:hypothetical protein
VTRDRFGSGRACVRRVVRRGVVASGVQPHAGGVRERFGWKAKATDGPRTGLGCAGWGGCVSPDWWLVVSESGLGTSGLNDRALNRTFGASGSDGRRLSRMDPPPVSRVSGEPPTSARDDGQLTTAQAGSSVASQASLAARGESLVEAPGRAAAGGVLAAAAVAAEQARARAEGLAPMLGIVYERTGAFPLGGSPRRRIVE